jgi:hypothetical protein
LPVITGSLGNIPNSDTLVAETIECSITSLIPDSTANQLNLLGGDNITISGANFPTDLSTSDVLIKFSDA